MKAKEFFQQIRTIDKQIESKLDQLERLKALATKATAQLREVSVSGSGNGRSMEDTIGRIIDLQNEINQDIDNLVDLKAKAMKILKAIRNEKQRFVLEEYYLTNTTFEQIAVKLDCTFQWVYELRKIGLRTAEKIMKKESLLDGN